MIGEEQPGGAHREGQIVLLCSDAPASRAIWHALRREFADVVVVEEDRVPRRQLLRRRLSRLGPRRVFGQVVFEAAVVPALQVTSRGRIKEIQQEFGLCTDPVEGTHHVPSVNSEEARRILAALHPAVTVVCGTRIIASDTLRCVEGPIINFHAGITPLYRGVHGGYWALAEGRRDLVGSTIHLVDEGIDTGGVIEQVTFEVSDKDTFVTYPYLHVAAAIPALVRAVRRARRGEALTGDADRPDLGSKLRTHPTAWEYLHRRRQGVR